MRRLQQFLWPVALLLTGFTTVRGAPVVEAEAVAVANVWYCMELNSGHIVFDSAERAERLRLLPDHAVSYQVSADTVLDYRPQGRTILAYIVKYQPHGYVVVPGDDRLNAVQVFGTESDFRWDHPELNFLRYYLSTVIPANWRQMGNAVHPNWTYLRSKLSIPLGQVKFERDVEYPVLWNTALWGQGQYYNDTVMAYTGSDPRVPTGCTATAMAIKMRFHSWPAPNGSGNHSYDDSCDGVLYHHTFNYGSWAPNWANMPVASLTNHNAEVATLMYACGVAVDMDYEPNWSGAWSTASSMNGYFRYKGTTDRAIYHDIPAKTSILGRLPVVASSESHTVVLDGFREPTMPYFHVNCGWNGGSNGWYDLDSLPAGDPIAKSNPYCQPYNWFYVDSGYSGTEDGNILTPYNTLSEGQSGVPVNGWLLVKEGTYTGSGNVPITFAGAKTIVSYNAGTANIGHKLTLTRRGRIDVVGNGQLKVH